MSSASPREIISVIAIQPVALGYWCIGFECEPESHKTLTNSFEFCMLKPENAHAIQISSCQVLALIA